MYKKLLEQRLSCFSFFHTLLPEAMNSKTKIAYVDKIVPDAYHGTELKKAQKILSNGKFTLSRGKAHYLGDGVYFFESSEWHAKEWCKRCFPNSEHGVICATVNLGKCLDLHNQEYKRLLQKVAIKLGMRGVKDITDSVVINFLATNIENFDTVRFTYVKITEKYKEIYSRSRIQDFSQLIICVRNIDMILNIKLVKNWGG
jgi:hypothetical protein